MTRRITTIALAPPAAAVALMLLAADASRAQEDGQIEFNNHCRTCHSMDEGDHRLGPSLHGIVGREAGSQEGFAYSSAMQASDVVWDEETLDRFLADTNSVVPGNNMTPPYSGIAEPDVRAAIVEFLRSGG
ncbi:MAG TPA: c-type cytochrome [Afifellaceae bacterium]|nr:c-type cytochrome [Afifellaceae bacterium]